MSTDSRVGLIIICIIVAAAIGLGMCSRNVSEYEDEPSWGRGLWKKSHPAEMFVTYLQVVICNLP